MAQQLSLYSWKNFELGCMKQIVDLKQRSVGILIRSVRKISQIFAGEVLPPPVVSGLLHAEESYSHPFWLLRMDTFRELMGTLRKHDGGNANENVA